MPPTLRPEGRRPSGRPEPVVESRERSVTESNPRPQGSRIPRDRLLDLFSDWRYHSAYELEHTDAFSKGVWMTLVGELIDYGYSFGRRGNSFIMRERSQSDRPQDLSDLLAGIDARHPEDANPRADRERAHQEVLSRQGVGDPLPERLEPDVEFLRADDEDSETAHDDHGFKVEDDITPLPEEGDRFQISLEPRGCVLPARKVVTATFAVLAKKESGKTYLAMVMAEELLRHKLPFVVIDPTGVWYGLCSLASAKPGPWEVIVLGGRHGVGGDGAPYELRPDMGSEVAELVIGLWPRGVVLDLSDMVPEDQHRFVADFGNKLFLSNRLPLHVFIDEADEFVPQTTDSTYKHQRRCLNVVDRIVRRGRVKGLGSTCITQRPAVINKNSLSQIDGLFILKLVAPHDIRAVESWIEPLVPSATDRNVCLSALPKLDRGELFFVQNGRGKIPLTRFLVRPKETFDSSKTPSMDDLDPVEPELAKPSDVAMSKVTALFAPGEGGDGQQAT